MLFIKLDKDIGDKYIRTINIWRSYVDYPIISYISVDKEYRRKKIATNLYIEGAKWMRELNLPLYSSTCQTDEARAVWKYMIEEKLAKPIRGPNKEFRAIMLQHDKNNYTVTNKAA